MRSLLPALALLSVLASACRKKSDASAAEGVKSGESIAVGPENITIAVNGSIMSGPSISGVLAPERAATVRAQIAGSVLQVYADAGQPVGAGAVLARLDASALTDAYSSARALVSSARASFDIASRDLARNQRLLAAGAIAERDIEQSRKNAAASNAALQDARSRLASAAKQLGYTSVRAPFGGIVSERPIAAGDVVQPGTAMFTVVDPSSVRLEASVPAEQLSSIRIGVPVTFTVSGYPGRTFAGRISRINPTVDPMTRQVRIYASIPNGGRTLVGGLFATGRLASSSHSGLIIPASALDTRGTVPSVMRIKQGRVERVEVQPGLRDESSEKVEITAGLLAGDTVLIGVAQGITPGTAVRVSAVNDRPIPTASSTSGG